MKIEEKIINYMKESVDKPVGKEFKRISKKLMPHQPSLRNVDDNWTSSQIDEYLFRNEGEYIGGMASVILSLIDKNIKV